MKSIANEYGLSVCNVNRIFDCLSYKLTGLPMVLSTDEFKGTTNKGKYHCILYKLVANQLFPQAEVIINRFHYIYIANSIIN